MQHEERVRWFLLVFLACFLVSSCASPARLAKRHAVAAENHVTRGQWLDAVMEYRKAYDKTATDAKIALRLRQVEFKAAEYYYQRGAMLYDKGDIEGAIVEYEQGLAAMSDNDKLRQSLALAVARQDAERFYAEGLSMKEAGRKNDARQLFEQALKRYPEHDKAKKSLAESQMEVSAGQQGPFASRTPITLNFRQTDLRAAFEFIAKAFDVNIVFDEGIRNMQVTLFAKDVSFTEAMNFLSRSTKTFYKKIGPNTIVVAQDSKDKREHYEDQIIRTFGLRSIRAKDMAEIIKGVMNVKKISINEQMNTLVLRDNEEVLALAERLVENNDRKPAEMILEVEILEVNRSKAERLGLDLTSYEISASVPSIPVSGSISKVIEAGARLTLPRAVLRFYKQEIDAKTLANPKIRVLNNKSAKIHIGDRVPLRAATITDALGQVRTSYEYREIGIRLSADPTINTDNSALVKLSLEVSSLGENIGSSQEPAFRIGTRNAETIMLLRDGETAILGGLIRDEDRKNRAKIPLLGDIPALGTLFAADDDTIGRTDILLTITPRVVRGWDAGDPESQRFFSGTGELYQGRPLFPQDIAAVGQSGVPMEAVASLPMPAAVSQPLAAANALAVVDPGNESDEQDSNAKPLGLRFARDIYSLKVGQSMDLVLMADNGAAGTRLDVDLTYSPQLIKMLRPEAGNSSVQMQQLKTEEGSGVTRLRFTLADGASGAGGMPLARLHVEGAKMGMAQLSATVGVATTAQGETVDVQVKPAQIVVRQ